MSRGSPTDRIEKQIVLRAPLARVWAAISDAARFGAWFGCAFDGPFVAGATVGASMVPTTVDPEVARLQEPHAGTRFDVIVDEVTPMRRLAFRWYPFGADQTRDERTLVAFELEEVEGGVRLTVTESGFDRLPPERRGPAFAANAGGWDHQTRLVAAYLAHGA